MKINKISALILSFFLAFMACETEESITITSPDASFTLLEPSISNINITLNNKMRCRIKNLIKDF